MRCTLITSVSLAYLTLADLTQAADTALPTRLSKRMNAGRLNTGNGQVLFSDLHSGYFDLRPPVITPTTEDIEDSI